MKYSVVRPKWFFQVLSLACIFGYLTLARAQQNPVGTDARPNILLAISDDQSYPHASIYGYRAIKTPAFDRVAREGVLFNNAICPSPGCAPSRAALLTGRYPWQNEHAGTHASSFPAKLAVYPDLLEKAGYFVGFTGKGWGPGDWKAGGRSRNPAGPAFSKIEVKEKIRGINEVDYAANFQDFLKKRPEGRPFCFWYGSTEPHRVYDKGRGLRSGMKLEDVVVPPFLPDTPEIRGDILDYCWEIQYFDSHLASMLKALEEIGELDNTLIVVTSDNGMPFPRSKGNVYEFGIHMPMAVRWPRHVPGGRVVDDPVSFVDLTKTFLEVGGVPDSAQSAMVGKSLMNILVSDKQGMVDPTREMVFSARERHSSSRYNNWGYPQRALRTQQYLYIRNFKPERWPAGDPRQLKEDGTLDEPHSGYTDIDSSPSLTFLIEKRDDARIGCFFHLAVDKRPAEELYDIKKDPGCLNNLAVQPEFQEIRKKLSDQLVDYLRKTGDPRVVGDGEIFETYERYSPIRKFPPPGQSE